MKTVEDVDIDTLLYLPLEDVRRLCQTDKYFNHLCQSNRVQNKLQTVKNKVNKMINYIPTQTLILQPVLDVNFGEFRPLLDISKMTADVEEKDKTVYDDNNIFSIFLTKITDDKYFCIFYFDEDLLFLK